MASLWSLVAKILTRPAIGGSVAKVSTGRVFSSAATGVAATAGDKEATKESTSKPNDCHHESFAELFRSSLPVACGRRVPAVITAITDKEMYVDFGSKFHAVLPVPKGPASQWRRGVWVEVKVKDLEHTQHFLGNSRHTSLLEADVELIGLLH